MSRTYRHIPYWAKRQIKYGQERTNIERDSLYRGFDKHKALSGIYLTNNFNGSHGFREEYSGKARIFYKRKYHKAFRKWFKHETQNIGNYNDG